MKNAIVVLSLALIGGITVSCSPNPADSVPAAQEVETTESVEMTAPAGEATAYTFTADSEIGFVGSKVTGKHVGGFKEFSGFFSTDGQSLVGDGNKITIDMASTWSDDDKLTGHLKSPDFFDVEQFPESSFTVSSVAEAEGDDAYTVTGDFTLHGVTKTIGFPATVTVSAEKVTMDSEFAINRKDYGIVYPGMPDDLIRDEVVISLNMVATPAEG